MKSVKDMKCLIVPTDLTKFNTSRYFLEITLYQI